MPGLTSRLPRVPDGVLLSDSLLSRMNEERAITVVRAPAGFGKTTLLACWLTAAADALRSVAWLRVDRIDGGPEAVWAELADQLSGDDWRDEDSARAAVRRALRLAPGPVLVAIDAFERADADGLDADLIELIRDNRHLQLLVALRTEHHFPRRMWADLGGEELGAADLTVSPDQIRGMLAQRGVRASAEQVAELYRGTAGWPVAIGLLMTSISDGGELDPLAATAAIRRALRRWVHELFKPTLLDELVLPSAVPDEFTAADLRAMQVPAAAVGELEYLNDVGLLTAERVGDTVTYRWPDVIRGVLLDELSERTPEELRALHARLGHHFAGAWPTAARALMHSAAADDWPQAMRIVKRWWGRLAVTDLDLLRRVLGDAPAELLTGAAVRAARELSHPSPNYREILRKVTLPKSPDALEKLAHRSDLEEVITAAQVVGYALRVRDMLPEALAHFDRLETIMGLAQRVQPALVVRRHADVQLHAGITRLIAGELEGALLRLERAYQRGGVSEFEYTVRDAAAKAALVEAIRGETRRAADWVRRAEQAPDTRKWVRVPIEASLTAARLLIAAGRMDARAAHSRVYLDAEGTVDEIWLFTGHAQAAAALVGGDRIGALRLINEQADKPRHAGGAEFAHRLLLADEVDLLMSIGSASRAAARLDGADPSQPHVLVRRARLALYAGKLDAALDRARAAAAVETGWADIDVEALLIEAIAYSRMRDETAARDALLLAVRRATGAGCLRPFSYLPRAELAVLADDVPEAAAALGMTEIRSDRAVFAADLRVVTLTAREQTILRRLAAGDTLPQIADVSFVSINTIKTQVRKLYRKLGAADRGEALTRAREQGLL